YVSSLTVNYGTISGNSGYVLTAYSDSGYVTPVKSSVTYSVSLSTLSFNVGDLQPNTTYWLRVGSLWSDGTTSYADTVPPSTSTLTNPITGQQIYGVFYTSVTVNWPAYAVGSGTGTAEGYRVEASTMAGFIPLTGSSVTYDVT